MSQDKEYAEYCLKAGIENRNTDPTNHHVSTDKHDPLFTPLGQLWPLRVEQKPLTDEVIRLLVGGNEEAQEWNRKVVREVERAHGIGEKE